MEKIKLKEPLEFPFAPKISWCQAWPCSWFIYEIVSCFQFLWARQLSCLLAVHYSTLGGHSHLWFSRLSQQWLTKYVSAGKRIFANCDSVFKTPCFPRELVVCGEQRVRGRCWSSCPAAGECWSGLSLATGPHWPGHRDRRPWPGPAPHHRTMTPVHARPDNRLH